jgi:DNA-directed RNA polymerase specialized sigma24 family protein
MQNALKGERISVKAIKNCYYDELMKVAIGMIGDTVKAKSIVQSCFGKAKRLIAGSADMNTIKSSLYIMVLQECNEHLQHIDRQHKIHHEKYYHQLIFYISYFVPRDKASFIVDKTFEQLKKEYANDDDEKTVETNMKTLALKLCLQYMERVA